MVDVNNVIKGKLLESETLKQQATNNTTEQFANSPALNSETVREGLNDVLLGPARLYETFRGCPTELNKSYAIAHGLDG